MRTVYRLKQIVTPGPTIKSGGCSKAVAWIDLILLGSFAAGKVVVQDWEPRISDKPTATNTHGLGFGVWSVGTSHTASVDSTDRLLPEGLDEQA